MAGAVALPPDGPHWQAMRLSRNRHWGLPVLVDYIQTLARDAAAQDGWPGLLVGDMAQPRGGPMLTGHASHQTGLDVDIWLMPMPDRRLSEREREDIPAPAVVEPGPHEVFEDEWTPALGRLIRRAALDPRVERIFVAPGIKKELCETMGSDRTWMSKVRPYYGHHDHIHVRLSCPRGTPCRAQDSSAGRRWLRLRSRLVVHRRALCARPRFAGAGPAAHPRRSAVGMPHRAAGGPCSRRDDDAPGLCGKRRTWRRGLPGTCHPLCRGTGTSAPAAGPPGPVLRCKERRAARRCPANPPMLPFRQKPGSSRQYHRARNSRSGSSPDTAGDSPRRRRMAARRESPS